MNVLAAACLIGAASTTTWVAPAADPVAIVHAAPGDSILLNVWLAPPDGEWVNSVSLWHGLVTNDAATLDEILPQMGTVVRAEVIGGNSWLTLAQLDLHEPGIVAALSFTASDFGQSCLGTMPLAGSIGVVGEPCIEVSMLGDLDGSLSVDGLDVEPFVSVMLSGEYRFEADMTRDMQVNGLDVGPFVGKVVSGVEAVSEPESLVLATIGGLAFVVVRILEIKA